MGYFSSYYFAFCCFCWSCNSFTQSPAVVSDQEIRSKGKASKLNKNFPSGIYEDISLAHDTITKTVTGVYQYYDNWNEHFREYLDVNVFYFSGKEVESDTINVKAFWPDNDEKIQGRLIIGTKHDSGYLQLHLNKQPLGYNDVDFTKASGVLMKFEKPRKWFEIRIIKSAIAKIYSLPDSLAVRKGYLIRKDVVKLLSKKNGWCYIEYNPKNDNTKSAQYWLREEDLFSINVDNW